jgi:ribosomal protein S1
MRASGVYNSGGFPYFLKDLHEVQRSLHDKKLEIGHRKGNTTRFWLTEAEDSAYNVIRSRKYWMEPAKCFRLAVNM